MQGTFTLLIVPQEHYLIMGSWCLKMAECLWNIQHMASSTKLYIQTCRFKMLAQILQNVVSYLTERTAETIFHGSYLHKEHIPKLFKINLLHLV